MADIVREIHHDLEGFYVYEDDGTRGYIRLTGANVRSFNPGWSPLFVYSGMHGLHFLELLHENGHRATWFLNTKLERLCDAVSALPQPFDETLRAGARALRADIWTQLMLASASLLRQATIEFFRINAATRAQVLAAALESGAADAAVVNIANHPGRTLVYQMPTGELVLQKACLEAIIRAPIKERFIEACNAGVLTWPSPIDEAPMQLLGGLFLSDFCFAYRMLDKHSGLVVVVLSAQHDLKTLAVFLPQVDIIVVLSDSDLHELEMFFGPVVPMLTTHLWDHAVVLQRYFSAANFGFASVLRAPPHLGHQLWNELSAIDDLVQTLPPERRPTFLVPHAAEGTEIYGPIDVLFPEIAGLVLRFDQSVGCIITEAYMRQLCVTRITASHVSARLRSRTLAFANSTSAGRKASAIADAISSGDLPIVLIGLRVENRTVVDLPRFLISLIERIVEHIGAAAFVIDGHNRRFGGGPDTTISSHWEFAATRRPQEVECDVVDLLVSRFANTNAYIISNIGAPISSSVVWCTRSQMFFAIWGAGLAKYRWVANKPGFIISSAWNLLYRHDLHIYNAPQFMEDPTQVHFADLTSVTDRLDQIPLVVPSGTLSAPYANFDVSIEALWPQVSVFLNTLNR